MIPRAKLVQLIRDSNVCMANKPLSLGELDVAVSVLADEIINLEFETLRDNPTSLVQTSVSHAAIEITSRRLLNTQHRYGIGILLDSPARYVSSMISNINYNQSNVVKCDLEILYRHDSLNDAMLHASSKLPS